VTLAFYIRKEINARTGLLYFAAQIVGAIIGVFIAHLMFENPLIDPSTHARTGTSQWISEFVATFGLVATILGLVKSRPEAIPFAVGLYITAAYWFTSSTSFANPAVTIARGFSNTFAGIDPSHVAAFIVVQLFAAVVATFTFKWLLEE